MGNERLCSGDLSPSDAKRLMIAVLSRDSIACSTTATAGFALKIANISKAAINLYVGREIPGWQELGLDSSQCKT